MFLPPANCTVDIYRGFNRLAPYPKAGSQPAISGVSGYITQHVRCGRFGSALHHENPPHWTTVLLLPPNTDIREGYNYEFNVPDYSQADTVIVPDYPIPGRCTAFMVVFVTRVFRGQAGDHWRCVLDRCLTQDSCFGNRTLDLTDFGPFG